MSSDDFASMMQQTAGSEGGRTRIRLRTGQSVTGTVVQIGHDSVFVDVGGTVEGRIDRRELEDNDGQLKIKAGDSITASVVTVDDVDGPRLSVALGRGSRTRGLDIAGLESARDGRVPVEGVVGSAVKGGVEVQVLGARGFCPASQLGTEFVADLSTFVGQTLEFLVTEVKNGGRDVIVSRKALMLEQQARQAQATLETLEVGNDYPATVTSVQKYGAFVDLGGGVEGLIHVSELAHGRVERVEDMLNVGESITVRLLAIQPPEKAGASPRLRLSLRALLDAPERPTLERGEVLEAVVSKVESFGVFVDTPKGSGLVPTRELGTPRGSDSRRIFPIGSAVRVVMIANDPSRGVTFSIARVASVEERQNYREFTQAQRAADGDSSLGSFGALLAEELNLPPPPPPARPAPAPTPPAPAAAAAQAAAAPVARPAPAPAVRPPAHQSPAHQSPAHQSAAPVQTAAPAPSDRTRVDTGPAPTDRTRVDRTPPTPPKGGPPDGVIRGRRRPKQGLAE